MINKILFTFLFLFSAMTPGQAQELDAAQVLNKTVETYRSLKSFHSTVKVLFNTNISAERTTGHLLLARPNSYKVDWRQASNGYFESGGVSWNMGDGPLFYLFGSAFYTKINTDEMNLISSSGVSRGISHLIPSAFYSFAEGNILPKLAGPELLGEETISGEECYKIQAKTESSPQFILWISKKSGLILQTQEKLDPGLNASKMELTDDQIKDALTKMGREVNEQNIAQTKKMMAFSKETLEKSPLREATKITNYVDIQVDAELKPEDFKYVLPTGVAYKPYAELMNIDIDRIKAIQNSVLKNTQKNQAR